LVLVEPSLVGDFDGDLGVVFALFDEPSLLGFCETSFGGDAFLGTFSKGFEAAFLVGIPPVFEGAHGVVFAGMAIGPWA
jgi:hypothetical protein